MPASPLRKQAGTYALVLRSERRAEVRVGRWGYLGLVPGFYIYVGSAFGPGGVRARVSRHLRETKSRHWHIDYLRELTKPVCAWFSYAPARLEHQWAREMAAMTDVTCVSGFGCSDCGCDGHLFFAKTRPDIAEFCKVLGGSIESWKP